MSHTTAPTADELQAAFADMRSPDWPATLAELQTAAARYAVVLGVAQARARGLAVPARELPNLRAQLSTPPARTFEHPARLTGTRPTPARRHGDTIDLKRLASGDRDD